MPPSQIERKEPTLFASQPQEQTNPFEPPRSKVELKARSGKLWPHQKAGRVIRLMAGLGAIAVVGIGAAVISPAISRGTSLPAEIVAMLCIGLALVIALFFVARAVMRYETWGRYAGIAYGLFSLIGFPIGTLVGGYILWHLVFGWVEGAADA